MTTTRKTADTGTAAAESAAPVNGHKPNDTGPPTPAAPTFTYTFKDGETVTIPAHSTIRGEVDGVTYFEMLWLFDEDNIGPADQIFTYLRRAHVPREVKRVIVRREPELQDLFRAWINDDTQPQTGPPPES